MLRKPSLVSMSLIPSGELKVKLIIRSIVSHKVSMSLIPSGELKVAIAPPGKVPLVRSINESNSLRGVERQN